jgi:1,2-phenylacetyl-CoA epoxidase catalytic subunit
LFEYWSSINAIVVAEVDWRELKEKEPNNPNLLKYGISREFKDEVKEMFMGKSKAELEEMETEINDTLNSNEVTFKLDFDYWEKIMKKLKVYKAKATLKVYYDRFCKDMKYKSMRQTDQIVLDDEINTRDL